MRPRLIVLKFALLVVLLSLPLSGRGQSNGWRWLTGGDLYGVKFIGQKGWMYGYDGTQGLILHSTDGGEDWAIQLHNTPYSFSNDPDGLFFLDEQNGWIVGGPSGERVFLRTRDGGGTWTLGPSPIPAGLWAVFAIDTVHVWVSKYDTIFRSTDGGNTWSGSQVDYYVTDLCFYDSLMGWAMTNWGKVLKTTDGGRTWGHRTGLPYSLYSLEMADTLRGWVAGDPANSYITTNNWVTWTTVPIGGGGYIHDISFHDIWNGMMAGRGVYTTTNGGASWRRDSLNAQGLEAVDAKQWPLAWAAGRGGALVKTTNGGNAWRIVRNTDSYYWDILSVNFADPDYGWAGSNGTVFHSTNGGTVWRKQTGPGMDTWLYGVDAVDRNYVWACGQDGRIFGTTNGGATWAVKDTNRQWELFSISCADTLWNVSAGGGYEGPPRNQYPFRIIKSTSDGGRTWQRVKTTYVPYLKGASAVKGGLGWVCGGGGTILHTANYGATWQAQTSGTGEILMSVVFLDSLHGWICGTAGTTLWTTDGGNNWNRGTGTTLHLAACTFADSLNGFAINADNAYIVQTTDGGRNWFSYDSKIRTRLRNVFAFDSTHAWIVGNYGMVLGYGDAGRSGVETRGQGDKEASGRGVALEQSYPNPMRENCAINFWLPKEEKAELSIYDVAGRKIREWVIGRREGGKQAIQWDGKDEKGRKVPGGVYFYRLRTGSWAKTRKMVVVR